MLRGALLGGSLRSLMGAEFLSAEALASHAAGKPNAGSSASSMSVAKGRIEEGGEPVGEEWWREATKARSAEPARKMDAQKTPVWRIDVYPFTQDALATIARNALAGDATSAEIIRHVTVMGQEEAGLSSKDRPSCLTCDSTFSKRRPPSYLSVLTGHCNDPNLVRITGICHDCVRRFGSEEGIQKAAFEACRRNLTSTHRSD
jgi:hypothetical protein